MSKTTGFLRIQRLLKIPKPNEKGQSLIIIAFAFLGLLAMLGLALDLGLVYIERTRIKRAVDAAVLAGVVELPNEEQAFIRAIDYLDQNGYRLQDNNGNYKVNMYIRGCSHERYLDETDSEILIRGHDNLTSPGEEYTSKGDLYYPPDTGGVPVENPVAEFILNTRSFQSTDGEGNFLVPASVGDPDPLCESDPALADPPIFGTANKFHITGIVPVRMNFMQFFGFGQVEVSDKAVAQNVTQLDVAVVFDISGSMQYDTVCHGCYEQYGDGNSDDHTELPWQDLRYPENYGPVYPILEDISGYPDSYPNTFIYPIPIAHLPRDGFDGTNNAGIGSNDGELCFNHDRTGNPTDYVTISGGGATQYFIVMEAELYSRNNSIYETSFRQPGTGYWAIQHSNYRTVNRMLSGSPDNARFQTGATPILPDQYDRGSWVSHHPFKSLSREAIGNEGEPGYEPAVPFGTDYDRNDARNNTSPSLDYEFITSDQWNGRDDTEGTHIYARLQGGDAYWAVYANADGGPGLDAFDPAPLGTGDIEQDTEASAGEPQDAGYGGAQASHWRWIELTGNNSTVLDLNNSEKYTLRIWAGQAGVDIDQIVIANTTVRDDFFDAGYDNGATYPDNDKLHVTAGSAFGQACNRCNPIYGQVIDDPADCLPTIDNGASQVSARYYDEDSGSYDMRKDEIFGGYQPIRQTKEALKRFIGKLNPQFDQVGIVAYNNSTSADRTMDLRCLRSDASSCFTGANPVTYTQVINLLEKYPANGSTNIAQAMRDGLFLLGVGVDGATNRPGTMPALPGNCSGLSCARGASAKRVMIVMTDGVANRYPSGTDCDADYTLFEPDLDTISDPDNDRYNRARDCVIYYAQEAADENIIIYTIGLGNGADVKLLEQVAEEGSGQYFAAQTPAKLNEIFDVILKSISVRLIQ